MYSLHIYYNNEHDAPLFNNIEVTKIQTLTIYE